MSKPYDFDMSAALPRDGQLQQNNAFLSTRISFCLNHSVSPPWDSS